MITAAKTALEIYIPHQTLPADVNEVQHNNLSLLAPLVLEKEILTNTFQELPGLLMLWCAAPPADISMVEVLREDQGLWM